MNLGLRNVINPPGNSSLYFCSLGGSRDCLPLCSSALLNTSDYGYQVLYAANFTLHTHTSPSLEQFEDWAVERLRLLRIVEKVNMSCHLHRLG